MSRAGRIREPFRTPCLSIVLKPSMPVANGHNMNVTICSPNARSKCLWRVLFRRVSLLKRAHRDGRFTPFCKQRRLERYRSTAREITEITYAVVGSARATDTSTIIIRYRQSSAGKYPSRYFVRRYKQRAPPKPRLGPPGGRPVNFSGDPFVRRALY